MAGSSSGIGAASAIELAKEGWNVVVHCRAARAKAERVAATIRELGRETMVLAADLADDGTAEAFAHDAWERTGGVDVWFQNAGADLLTGEAAGFDFKRKLEIATRVDLWGTIHACKAIGARMKERGRGVVLTMGWDQSATGMEGDSGEFFAAVKAGVAGFSRSLARSLAPEVRVVCIAPGWIRTLWGATASEKWQERAKGDALLARWGEPIDVARAVCYLASPDAAFVTGQTFLVNGGAVTT